MSPAPQPTISRTTALDHTLRDVAAFEPDGEILRAVQRDPFASITEIKREINRHPGRPIVGWWRIFAVLRKNQLLSRRSRFYYARGR